MTELCFRDGIMDRIRAREPRYAEGAYLFVLAALEHAQSRLAERRHISGAELAAAVRELALARFGVTARLVLEHWGVRATGDIGDIVFTLVDLGLLISQPNDTREEFSGLFDFDQAFEREYPWSAATLV
ncbi:MAG TPA: Minf_1886 family protein [Gemmatimonadaceae bacterium]|nr:Minf_1886 family protein [Gemmatimonadaceae bacterium]